jgi:hypothetical protein
MDALVFTLMTWIVAKTGLIVAEPPRIAFIPKLQFEQAYNSDSRQDEKLPTAKATDKPEAAPGLSRPY